LEVCAKDTQALELASAYMAPGADISITFLPGEDYARRVEMARQIRNSGLNPIPHISARRIGTALELDTFLERLSKEAAVDSAFVIAGDLKEPRGVFADALTLIVNAQLARYGIRRVGIAGYPDGHPDISDATLWEALKLKGRWLEKEGYSYEIVTQFSFDSDAILAWLERLRQAHITAPVKIGVPGPASAKSLLKYAARCGVGASSRVMAKYGLSLTKLLSQTGPDALLCDLQTRLHPSLHGDVRLHFYPFGGILQTAEWARQFQALQQAG
jgi:methylenetetrahydrofolate reductase (NADPH)